MSEELRGMMDELLMLRAELEQLRSRGGSGWLNRSSREVETEQRYRDLLHATSRRLVDEVGFERAAEVLAGSAESESCFSGN